MTDKTGHADKPGAGPFDAQYVCSHGMPSGHYTYQNPSTGRFEAAKISPNGVPDVTVADNFCGRAAAMQWIEDNTGIRRLIRTYSCYENGELGRTESLRRAYVVATWAEAASRTRW